MNRRRFLSMLGLMALFDSIPFSQANAVALPFDIYLTFDDGPTSRKDFKSGPTDRTLDILRETKTTATFFLHGRAINRWEGPTLVRYIRDGHAIGNHLWQQGGNTVQDGPNWALLAWQYIETEIQIRTVLEKMDNGAYTTYMAQPKLFRRPGGSNGLNKFLDPQNFDTIRAAPYMRPALPQIDWLKSVYDYSGWHINGGESIPPAIRPLTPDTERMFILDGGHGYYGVRNYLEPHRSIEADGGLIILMHDASETTIGMLPALITTLTEMGARFKTLPRPMDKPNSKTVGIGYAPTRKP